MGTLEISTTVSERGRVDRLALDEHTSLDSVIEVVRKQLMQFIASNSVMRNVFADLRLKTIEELSSYDFVDSSEDFFPVRVQIREAP